MGELSDNEQEGPTSISVLCRAMDGDESGEMQSPGVEKIHQILEDADLKVNVNVIWDIYKENEWEPHTSFDQAKFTTLWAAVVSVAETIPSNEQGGEIVLSDQHADEPKVEEKSHATQIVICRVLQLLQVMPKVLQFPCLSAIIMCFSMQFTMSSFWFRHCLEVKRSFLASLLFRFSFAIYTA